MNTRYRKNSSHQSFLLNTTTWGFYSISKPRCRFSPMTKTLSSSDKRYWGQRPKCWTCANLGHAASLDAIGQLWLTFAASGHSERRRLHTFVSELNYVSWINYTTGLLHNSVYSAQQSKTNFCQFLIQFSIKFNQNLIHLSLGNVD